MAIKGFTSSSLKGIDLVKDATKEINSQTETLDLSDDFFQEETLDLDGLSIEEPVDGSVISSPTEEDIQALVGSMNEEQYDQFVEGVEDYYDKQANYLESLLRTEDNKGYEDILSKVNTYIQRVEHDRILDPTDPHALDGLEEYGVTDYKSALEFQKEMQAIVDNTKESINMSKNLRDSAKYDYLSFLEDYDNYSSDIKVSNIDDIDKYKEDISENTPTAAMAAPTINFSYSDCLKDNPDITPLEFVKQIQEKYPNIDFTCYGIKNVEDLKKLAKASEYAPEMVTKYKYLYEQDPEKAEQYLKDIKYELNNIMGQIEAKEFLDKLAEAGDDEDKLDEIVYNELGVHLEGLYDGLDSFVMGMYHTGEAGYTGIQKLGKTLGIYDGEIYENRVMDQSEYKKMYILQALLSKEQKEEAGLLNIDGTSTNPIIDFSKEYTGKFLNNNYEISQGIGNMIPSIALSYVNPALGSTALGLSAGGNAYHGAMVEGSDYLSALMYGVFTGSSEAITERMLGGLPGLSDVQVKGLKTYLKAMGKEGGQEIVQGVMDEAYQWAMMGKELPTKPEEWAAWAKDIGKQGIYGAITAGYLNMPSVATSSINLRDVNKHIKNNNYTSEEVKLAVEQIRNQDPKLKKLSDNSIKIKFKNQLYEKLKINKLVSLGIHDEVAEIMVKKDTTEEIATYMLENNIDSVEEAEKALKLKPIEERKDYFEDIDLSKYDKTQCHYKLKQLLDVPNYENICNVFFDMAPSKKARATLQEILLRGEFDGFSFSSKLHNRNNPSIEASRRIAMANLYVQNPESFKYIVKNKIDLFHGTNANALESIINNGLFSLSESSNKGIEVTTGEEWSRGLSQRGFVSFADIFDISKYYSQISGEQNNADLDFPIIIGTTTAAADKAGTIKVWSDVCEIGVRGKLDPSEIKAIFVPEDKVEITKKIVGDKVEVLQFNEKESFYNADDYGIDINEEEVQKLKEEINKNYESKFSEDIKAFAKANDLSYEVAEIMVNDKKVTIEQARALDQIIENDPTMELEDILPSVAENVLKLQKITMAEGMTLKEYANQKGPDLIAPELQAEADALAELKRAEAEAVEPQISNDMKNLEGNGKYLLGFNYRLKGVESLSRKILSDFTTKSEKDPTFTIQDAYDRIGDSVRYTLICDPKTYTDDVRKSMRELLDKGYTIRHFRNTFDNPKYKGVNVGLYSPSGHILEIQFHTEQSFLYKDRLGHLYYEIARNDFASPEAIEIANILREQVASEVILPEGVLGLTEESIYNYDNDKTNEEMKSVDPSKIEEFDEEKYKNFCIAVDADVNISQENLPENFKTVDEYKKFYVNLFIEDGMINVFHNAFIAKLCEDPVICREIISKTERLEYLLEKNYLTKKADEINEDIISKLNEEDINNILNKPAMKDFINSLSPYNLATFMGNLSKVFDDKFNCKDIFIDKICSFNDDELIEFSKKFGYSSSQMFSSNFDNPELKNNVIKLLDKIASAYKEENHSKIKDIKYCFDALTPYKLWDVKDQDILKAFDNMNLKKDEYFNTFNNLIKSTTDIEFTPGYGKGLNYSIEGKHPYVDIEVEIDGKPITLTERVYGKELDINNKITYNQDLLNALLEGKLKIKDIKPNDMASNMVLDGDNGLQDGINYITYKVDGVEHVLTTIDNRVDLYQHHKESTKDFELISVESMGKLNKELSEADIEKLYKVSYEVNGEEKITYMSPKKNYAGEIVLGIESYVFNNNIFGAKNFKVEETNIPKISFDSIYDLSSFNEIFRENAYGGDQGKVENLVRDYFANPISIPTTIEEQKAKMLVEMIRDKFPNATNMDITNIAYQYAESGCYYMAVANAFELYVGNLENGEEIFREKFGFDLKTTDGNNSSYNLEALALDIFLRKALSKTSGDIKKISDVGGISMASFDEDVVEYFQEKGISLKKSGDNHLSQATDYKKSLLVELLNHQDKSMHIFHGSKFDIELFEHNPELDSKLDGALKNAEIKGKVIKDIDPHAMFITGIDEEGNLIVSTWGEKAKLLNGKIGDSFILSLDFEIDNTN